MIQEKISFQNDQGQALVGILRIPDGEGVFPAVIICHGIQANKDRELLVDIANALSYANFITVRFDFHGHGESQGLFEHFTISNAMKDLKAAVQFVERILPVNKKRIGVIGHSLGSIIALLYTPQDPNIKVLAAIASRASAQQVVRSHFNDHEILQWKKDGWILLEGKYKLNVAFYHDQDTHDC